jgi:hypothetical protein
LQKDSEKELPAAVKPTNMSEKESPVILLSREMTARLKMKALVMVLTVGERQATQRTSKLRTVEMIVSEETNDR